MALTINTNLNSMGAQRHAGRSQHELSSTIARLSSGLRINNARDDAAGLAISDRFTAQIRGTNQAARNANDAISLSQTAESALGSVSEGLQRIRELAVQATNATNSASDRAALQQEVTQLVQEVDRVATQTQFNGISLLDGSFTAKAFQVGADAGQTITSAQLPGARATDLGLSGAQQGFTGSSATWGMVPLVYQPMTVTIGSHPPLSLGDVYVDGPTAMAALEASNLGFTFTRSMTNIPAGVSGTSATAAGTATLTINGRAIAVNGVIGGGSLAANRAAAVNAINSAGLGLVATDTGSGVSFQSPEGKAVVYSYAPGTFTGSTASDFGLINSFYGGGVFGIRYVAPYGTTGNVSIKWGSNVINYALAPNGVAGSIDVSSVHGAVAATLTVDAALSKVNASRASLGAQQNRFGAALQTLQAGGDNLSAARGRIQDADFALETARFTRAQVLQEAGTAMIAQANQLPGQVLALLR